MDFGFVKANMVTVISVVLVMLLIFIFINFRPKTKVVAPVSDLQKLFDAVDPGMQNLMSSEEFMKVAGPLNFNESDYINLVQLYSTGQPVTIGDYKTALNKSD